jgi:maltooligosyltrehalose trehalohydrolase
MTSVWAPTAKSVDLILGEQQLPLRWTLGGWWRGDHVLNRGERYTFAVDGKSFPDPRSPFQPTGVHGPSCHVDHNAFPWTDTHFQAPPLGGAVFYELHIGTFTAEGTFDAAISRLPHLVNLGVTHLEIMPVAEFLGNYGWGYDGVALFAPHHAYGGPEGLKRLVNACHEIGLAVVLDVVYNHLGPSGNYLPQFGPYFSQRHSTPWGSPLNLDGPDSDEVRRFLCDNAIMWLRDYHFDGLRLDAVHAMVDTAALPFLEQLAMEIDELQAHLRRHLILIAESDLNDPRVVRPAELGGYGIHAQWSDDIHHSLHAVITGETKGYYSDFGSLQDLADSMTKPFVYDGRHSNHRRRRHGRPPTGLSAHRFVAYLQNHDQLGNRARGERVCHLANTDRVKIGAALLLTSPYIPLLFQGEEWASTSPFLFFVDFDAEPELAKQVMEGRRREFEAFLGAGEDVPDPTDPGSFSLSKLQWSELPAAKHAEMLAWHKSLIRLRREVSDFTSGRLHWTNTTTNVGAEWLCVARGRATIVANFALEERCIPGNWNGDATLRLASKPECQVDHELIRMPPESVAIVLSSQDGKGRHDLLVKFNVEMG